MRPYKRRKFFIDRQFQLKYVLLVIFMLVLYTLVFVATLFIPQLLPLMFNAPPPERVRAAEILLLYHKHVWPAVFVVIPLFGLFSIFITHRVAGPVYRLKVRIRQLTLWNLDDRVTLRKGDDLQELADGINQLAAEMQLFVHSLQTNYADMSAQIDAVQQEIAANRVDEASGRQLIARLDASRQGLAAILARFRPPEP